MPVADLHVESHFDRRNNLHYQQRLNFLTMEPNNIMGKDNKQLNWLALRPQPGKYTQPELRDMAVYLGPEPHFVLIGHRRTPR